MNNLIEKKTYYIILFSYYQNLLTKKQQEIFKSYYEEDYSLSEISESLDISRNAVHDALKKVINNLEHYEACLNLKAKDDLRKELYKQYENQETLELINKLKEVE